MSSTYCGFTYPETHRHKPLEKKIHTIASGIYTFLGYTVSNVSIIIGDDGYILVDTGSSKSGAEAILAEIPRLTDKPLKAIILTHGHADHLGGGDTFLASAGNAAKDIPVWGHARFGIEQEGLLGLEAVAATRGKRQFGGNVPEELFTDSEILPRLPERSDMRPPKNIRPTHFVEGERLQLNICGISLELLSAPSETPDTIVVWLHEQKTLFTGDALYRCFPNSSPLRGCAYRHLGTWGKTLHALSELHPEAIVMGHTEPATGKEAAEMLPNMAKAVQHIFDATIKGMNEGKTPDELACSVTLPEPLRSLPYTAELYGAIPWVVRSVFAGHLGWFDGTPRKLMPLPPKEEALRMAALAGGAAALLSTAEKALQEKDHQWAAQLTDYILRLDDAALAAKAKLVQADALEALSHIILPITGKNYLLSCAIDLREGTI